MRTRLEVDRANFYISIEKKYGWWPGGTIQFQLCIGDSYYWTVFGTWKLDLDLTIRCTGSAALEGLRLAVATSPIWRALTTSTACPASTGSANTAQSERLASGERGEYYDQNYMICFAHNLYFLPKKYLSIQLRLLLFVITVSCPAMLWAWCKNNCFNKIVLSSVTFLVRQWILAFEQKYLSLNFLTVHSPS